MSLFSAQAFTQPEDPRDEDGELWRRCVFMLTRWFFYTMQSRARAAGKKHPKKRGQRATSNIFAMFDQAQIQEFKEVSMDSERHTTR